jgi:uncharacterized phiE125 gp8 family phage protein
MRLVLIQPPDVEPLTAQEAKARLNIGNEVSDDVMDSFISGARQQFDGVDGWLGRALNTQTWRGTFEHFPWGHYPHNAIKIPLPPLQQILNIEYLAGDGTPTTLDPAQYQTVIGQRSYIVPKFGTPWPVTRLEPDAVTIDFVCGYGDNPEDVPGPLRSAIALQVAHIRSLSARNLFVSLESVEGIGEKRYIVGTGSTDVIDAAVEQLISTYRVIS